MDELASMHELRLAVWAATPVENYEAHSLVSPGDDREPVSRCKQCFLVLGLLKQNTKAGKLEQQQEVY